MISSKIEIFVSEDSINFRKLGYLNLDSNEKTNFMARELKSVYLDTQCKYLKF